MVVFLRVFGQVLALSLLVAACSPSPAALERGAEPVQDGLPLLGPKAAARQFAQVADTVEPVAERVCRRRRSDGHCDFRIVIDMTPGRDANAFQTLDRRGEPVLIFTLKLVEDMRDPDELAFVMSHEASHHILDHLAKQQRYSDASARAYGEAAARGGADLAEQRRAEDLGAVLGARNYSKTFELQADYMGARIALAAGYDPLVGARYFQRLPDPGDEFLGSHPSNPDRMATVRRSVRDAKRGV